MTDQEPTVETRINTLREEAQGVLDNEDAPSDETDWADDMLWLIDQLTAAHESIRDLRAQEQEDRDVDRYLERNPTRPYIWPPATPHNTPSLTAQERKVANAVLSREGQRVRPIIITGSSGFPAKVYSEQEVAGIMSSYYQDQATQ